MGAALQQPPRRDKVAHRVRKVVDRRADHRERLPAAGADIPVAHGTDVQACLQGQRRQSFGRQCRGKRGDPVDGLGRGIERRKLEGFRYYSEPQLTPGGPKAAAVSRKRNR